MVLPHDHSIRLSAEGATLSQWSLTLTPLPRQLLLPAKLHSLPTEELLLSRPRRFTNMPVALSHWICCEQLKTALLPGFRKGGVYGVFSQNRRAGTGKEEMIL